MAYSPPTSCQIPWEHSLQPNGPGSALQWPPAVVIQREGKDRRRVEARRSHHGPQWITATLGTSGGMLSSRRTEQTLTFNGLSSRLVFSWRGKHRIFPGGFHEQLNPPRHGTSASPFSDQDLTAQKHSPPF